MFTGFGPKSGVRMLNGIIGILNHRVERGRTA